ncbi:hypothetical protein PJI16_05740 [Nitrospira sp. MA-1]|nr:hypothetical protein [Nitrospira sp. MA-1]
MLIETGIDSGEEEKRNGPRFRKRASAPPWSQAVWSTEAKFGLSLLFIHPHGNTCAFGFPRLDERFGLSNVLSSLAYIDSYLPVMVITGLTDPDQRLGQIGAPAFLHKPADRVEVPANKALKSHFHQAEYFRWHPVDLFWEC